MPSFRSNAFKSLHISVDISGFWYTFRSCSMRFSMFFQIVPQGLQWHPHTYMRRQQFTAAVIQGVLFYKVLSGVPYFMDKVKGNRVSIYINIFQIPLDKSRISKSVISFS